MSAYLSANDLNNRVGPFSRIQSFRLGLRRNSVDVGNLATLCISTENVQALSELLGLHSNGLQGLNNDIEYQSSAKERDKYLRVALNIQNRDVCIVVRVLLEVLNETVNSLEGYKELDCDWE